MVKYFIVYEACICYGQCFKSSTWLFVVKRTHMYLICTFNKSCFKAILGTFCSYFKHFKYWNFANIWVFYFSIHQKCVFVVMWIFNWTQDVVNNFSPHHNRNCMFSFNNFNFYFYKRFSWKCILYCMLILKYVYVCICMYVYIYLFIGSKSQTLFNRFDGFCTIL